MHQVKRVSRIALGTWTTRVDCQYLFQATVDVTVENPETPKRDLLSAMSLSCNSSGLKPINDPDLESFKF